MKKQKYQLASSKKFMEKESSSFTATFLKVPQGTSIYQLKKGKSLLDVIPYVVGKGNPNADQGMLYWERTFFVHRSVGPNQATYICPARTANKPCPICDDRAKLMRSDPTDEEFKTAKELNAKEWQIIQLYDRNDKEKGIQLLPLSYYRFGEAVRDAAAAGEEEDHWEIFWHPEGGKTLRVQWDEDSMGSQKFIRAKTVLFKDREELDQELIEAGHCLDDLLIVPDYKKLKAIYVAAAPDDAEEEEEKEEEEEEDTEEEETPKKKKKVVDFAKRLKKDEAGEESEEEEEEDSEEEEEDSEEDAEEEEEEQEEDTEEEAPPKKKKKKIVEEDAEEEEEEEEEEDSEEEEEDSEEDAEEEEEKGEEQETPKGGKFRTATDHDVKRAKKNSDIVKKKKKDAEEEDAEDPEKDTDWDNFENAEEDTEEEAPPKKKKVKK